MQKSTLSVYLQKGNGFGMFLFGLAELLSALDNFQTVWAYTQLPLHV